MRAGARRWRRHVVAAMSLTAGVTVLAFTVSAPAGAAPSPSQQLSGVLARVSGQLGNRGVSRLQKAIVGHYFTNDKAFVPLSLAVLYVPQWASGFELSGATTEELAAWAHSIAATKIKTVATATELGNLDEILFFMRAIQTFGGDTSDLSVAALYKQLEHAYQFSIDITQNVLGVTGGSTVGETVKGSGTLKLRLLKDCSPAWRGRAAMAYTYVHFPGQTIDRPIFPSNITMRLLFCNSPIAKITQDRFGHLEPYYASGQYAPEDLMEGYMQDLVRLYGKHDASPTAANPYPAGTFEMPANITQQELAGANLGSREIVNKQFAYSKAGFTLSIEYVVKHTPK